MKKFILGLFLILGAMSFAVPNYVNTTKIKSAGYEITTDDKDIFGLGKVTQEAAISVAIYPFGNNPNIIFFIKFSLSISIILYNFLLHLKLHQ